MEPALELLDEELLESDPVDEAASEDVKLELEDELDEPEALLSWLLLTPEPELEVVLEDDEDESEVEVELLLAEMVLPLPPGDLPLILMLFPVLSS